MQSKSQEYLLLFAQYYVERQKPFSFFVEKALLDGYLLGFHCFGIELRK